MSYSNLHIEDSHIKFFTDNPFISRNGSSPQTKANLSQQVQIIAENQNLGSKLKEAFKNCNLLFEKVTVHTFGYLEDNSTSSIIPLLKNSIANGVLSIFIGFNKSVLKAVFDGFQFAERPFNISHIQDDAGRHDGIDTLILPLADPYLHQLHLIGSQAILVNPSFLESYQDRGCTVHRLGKVRGNLQMVEPEIRASNIFSVNLNALKYPSAECQSSKSPIGFDAEEVCQLAHYAGRGELNQSFCIYEIDKDGLEKKQNIQLLVNLIWYYLQGVEFRESGFPSNVDKMKTYLIEGEIENFTLQFYKDENQQKWWLKCPIKTSKYGQLYTLISCDYQDYSAAVNDRALSDRLRSLLALL